MLLIRTVIFFLVMNFSGRAQSSSQYSCSFVLFVSNINLRKERKNEIRKEGKEMTVLEGMPQLKS